MGNKIIGYLVAVIGLVVTVASFAKIRSALKITLPFTIGDNYLFIAGLVLLILGAILSMGKRSGKQEAEVPIYHGDKVVGYRRMR